MAAVPFKVRGEGVQFILCEYSKIVLYILTRNKKYTRDYWKMIMQTDADEDMMMHDSDHDVGPASGGSDSGEEGGPDDEA